MASQYNRYGSRRKGNVKKIKASEEMLKLVPTSKICINAEGDMLCVYNGKERPIKVSIGDGTPTTINQLKRGRSH